ncbi:YbaL family putative K(+) efflux transporter [Viridibacterium curvum]|uniref:YbaL family putative K(+) efflux transporter n=1 Tax=Viridibacterium curvum TaxID=1101404 RepID=UPI003CD0A18A
MITTVAAALGLALVLGFAATRLRLPALVGYLVAGIMIGPATPGFVADVHLSGQLAEIGVMLLMFGVGLHFSLDDLMSVRRIALPGAIAQIVAATAMGAGVAWFWGWSLGAGIVFGLSLSVASTVVLLRALEGRGLLDTINGSIAVGWLVVEDLVMVLVLVLLPPLAGWLGGGDTTTGTPSGIDLLTTFGFTLGKVAVFALLMFVVGARVLPWILWQVARTGSRELFTLCVIAVAVGIAYAAAAVFGVSFALGAFLAGMVVGKSALSHRAATESLPLQDAFSVLFFVSVGMLFDPAMLIKEPLHVLGVVAIIMLGKTLAAFLLVLAFRYPLNTALTVSASLAQIGEFSFILAGLGVSLNLLPLEGQNLILAGALISIALNPLLFAAIEPVQTWIRSRSTLARAFERPDDPLAELPMSVESHRLTDHVLIVGYGRVGRRIGESLLGKGVPVVIAEQNRELVESLRRSGVPAVAGDAADPAVLIQAHVARARMLIIAIPDAIAARSMIDTARMLKRDIETVTRVHSEEEEAGFLKDRLGPVFMGEHELALSMTRHALDQLQTPSPQTNH